MVRIKLIAQEQAQFGQRWLLRQRSEQYLTSSQHFAHFLRHVIGRWQFAHARLGRSCLLPLKSLIFQYRTDFFTEPVGQGYDRLHKMKVMPANRYPPLRTNDSLFRLELSQRAIFWHLNQT
jgi:hypothetical protein